MAIISSEIDVGLFRNLVTFLNNSPTSDGAGGQTDNYIPFLTTWGQLRQTSGSRNLSTYEIQLENNYLLTVRYDPSLETLQKSNTKVSTTDGRSFTISNSTKVEELDFFYTFTLSQISH